MSLKTRRLLFFILVLISIPYSFVIYTKGTEKTYHLSPVEKKGKLVFQKYNCIACHQIYGLGGYLGPDLTNVMNQPNKNEIYVKSFIQNGTEVMPKFNLTEDELNSLVAYLSFLSKHNTYNLKDYEITYLGTFHNKKENKE
jgi:nitric oxide reductase subunit C